MSIEITIDNSSGEKLARARAGTQIAIWNDAMSWLGPLREYARISTAVRPALRSGADDPLRADSPKTSTDSTERRLLFLGWEVEALVAKHKAQFTSAHSMLMHVFFNELGFSISDDADLRRHEGLATLLDTVLARRTGPASLISILHSWCAEIVARAYGETCDFTRVEPTHGTPTEVVRVIPRNDVGEVWLVDLSERGARVDESVWSPWCATSKLAGFTRLTFAQGLVRSLTEMFSALEKMSNLTLDLLTAQLFVLDQVISLQPSETSRWAERAVLNTRRGDRTSALDDLKRFFAFHERDSAPAAIITLFDDLRRGDLHS
ncbi:hypothetical protein BH10BDE1_BH10BDE1_19430 [soil metagenome]